MMESLERADGNLRAAIALLDNALLGITSAEVRVILANAVGSIATAQEKVSKATKLLAKGKR